ncbi:hypothetical protein FHU33_3163 [Blastococcus colisei]|uniref:Uncharacterized protein n=1 Tax=Blastococcus colisei TaxID=1564162 RepID=A0A543PHY9_9ACTN|nr:hypothetical protein [Blastococcus colisei]TQN43701.1 hypothetical protein FHU33_3163 [Blastococcus colisei]
MSRTLARTAVLTATAATALLASAGTAAAAPACSDPVADALHTVHDTTGDPAGAVHAVEETYCSVS